MKIYIVRHGRPEGTEYGKRFLGRTDVPLSDDGRAEARETARRLAVMERGRTVTVWSGPLIRSLETAEVISEAAGSGTVVIDGGLSEIDMGDWDGRYFDEVMREHPAEFAERGRDLWNYRVPGGENFAEAGRRFCAAVERMAAAADGDEVIVAVSHAGAMRAGLSILTGEPFEKWMDMEIPYAGVITLEINGGAVSLPEVEK